MVCLDNAEKLKEIDAIEKLISIGATTIVIAQGKDLYDSLHPRIRSRISELIELKPYSTQQVFEILKRRAYKALSPRSFSEELLTIIAERSKGNMRLAIDTLRICAMKAEFQD